MREIKFRAWDGLEIVYNCGIVPDLGFAYHIPDGSTGEPDDMDYYEEFPAMQYTGLKDKNGVEIYEGDIVDDHYFKNSVSRHRVYWAENYGCWSTIDLIDPIIGRNQLAYFNETKNLHRNEYLEVIGNIYENPKLVEQS